MVFTNGVLMIKKNTLNKISLNIPIPSLDIVIKLGNRYLLIKRKKIQQSISLLL